MKWFCLQTAKLQLASQNTVDHPHEELYKTEVTDLKQRYDESFKSFWNHKLH